jgi:hypothetical protein
MAVEVHQPSAYVTCRHCGKKYRAITSFHLRNIHGYDGDHPINDYKSEFGLRFAFSRNSRKKISEAKVSYWDGLGQHWSPEDVLDEIRRIHRARGSLRQNKVAVRLYMSGRRLFGTWQAAVEAAGLNYEEVTGVRRWNRQRVVERVQQLAAAGVPLDASHVEEQYPYLHRAAIKLFPRSWAKALRAAGFYPDKHRQPSGPRGAWDEQLAKEWVRRRIREKQPILARDAPRDLLGFVYKHLGRTWPEFVESLGVTYPGVKKCLDWTKDKLLEEIRRWAAEGQRLNCRAVADEHQALIHQARKFFRSWDGARAAAGV